MKFIRRAVQTKYTQDQTIDVTIDGNVYPIEIEGLGIAPDTAIEVEMDDGTTLVLLGYLRK